MLQEKKNKKNRSERQRHNQRHRESPKRRAKSHARTTGGTSSSHRERSNHFLHETFSGWFLEGVKVAIRVTLSHVTLRKGESHGERRGEKRSFAVINDA